MLDLPRIGHIVSVLLHLHKVIGNNAEITLEHINLLSGKVCNFKQVDFVMVYEFVKLRRDIQPFLQTERFIPVTIIAIVQNQGYNRIF